MTSGRADTPVASEPSLDEFASELSAVAEEAVESLTAHVRATPHMGDPSQGLSSIDPDAILRIPVTMKVVVGSATLPVAGLKSLARGDTVALDRRVGEPVDIVVNGRVLAKGMLVIVDRETSQLGISLTEAVASAPARESGVGRRR